MLHTELEHFFHLHQIPGYISFQVHLCNLLLQSRREEREEQDSESGCIFKHTVTLAFARQ